MRPALVWRPERNRPARLDTGPWAAALRSVQDSNLAIAGGPFVGAAGWNELGSGQHLSAAAPLAARTVRNQRDGRTRAGHVGRYHRAIHLHGLQDAEVGIEGQSAPESRGSEMSTPPILKVVWFQAMPHPETRGARALHRPPLSIRSLMRNGWAVSIKDHTVPLLGRRASALAGEARLIRGVPGVLQ